MKKFAVVLAGCGVFDGSEIYETTITLLALSRAGIAYQCMAPNIEQHHVINHLTGEEMPEKRNVLIEAARLARGEVIDLAIAKAEDYDALLVPGGFGVAKNLSDFAFKGEECQVNVELQKIANDMLSQQKPMGFICIAPAILPVIFERSIDLTIGNDQETAGVINKLGGNHLDCSVGEIIVDQQHKIVTTPAYMLAEKISEAAEGIEKLVQKVAELA